MSRFQVLSDAQWSLIEGMLPRPTGRPGRKFSDARRWSRRSSTATGAGSRGVICRRCSVRGRRCGPGITGWQPTAPGTGCSQAHRRGRRGRADRLVAVGGLHDRSRASARDEHDPPHRGLDRTTRIRGVEPPDHGVGRSSGGLSTKIHQLVDGNGLPLVTLITPGQAGDSPMFLPLMAQLRVGRDVGRPRTRPGRGPRRQGVLVPRDPRAPALPRYHGRDPRTRRPEGPPQAPRITRRSDPSASTPPTTRTATSSSAATATSSNGEASPPATTSTPSSTAPPSSSTPSSLGPEKSPALTGRPYRRSIAVSQTPGWWEPPGKFTSLGCWNSAR